MRKLTDVSLHQNETFLLYTKFKRMTREDIGRETI